MKPLRTLTLLILAFAALSASAQDKGKIQEQEREVARHRKAVETSQQELNSLQKSRTTTTQRVNLWEKQINSRDRLLDAQEKQAKLLRTEIARKDSVAGSLERTLNRDREQYAAMVRESYRNYRQNNYLTYIFSSSDFTDVARRITILREAANARERKMTEIKTLSRQVAEEKAELGVRKQSLDSVTRNLASEKKKLQQDVSSAKSEIKKLSKAEIEVRRRQALEEQRLNAAIADLRKLTKGNTSGDSFTTKTSNLRLPVANGRVKRFRDNVAEITGPQGAQVISIYEGKVVNVKLNRITGKYDVFVAHGDYISSYVNLGTTCVEINQKVAKNQALGTIGSSRDNTTFEDEYKIIFGIYPPPGKSMRAEDCFKR